MKYILKFKNNILLLTITSFGFGSAYIIHGSVPVHTHQTRVHFEEEFLHGAIRELLDYAKSVASGKQEFFNLENKERYAIHKERFEEALEHINTIVPQITTETRKRAEHTDKKYSAIITLLHSIAQLLQKAQDEWVKAIKNNSNSITLGLALSNLEKVASSIKSKLINQLLPNLRKQLSDHALQQEVIELEHVISHIFTSTDAHGRPCGYEHLSRRFQFYP